MGSRNWQFAGILLGLALFSAIGAGCADSKDKDKEKPKAMKVEEKHDDPEFFIHLTSAKSYICAGGLKGKAYETEVVAQVFKIDEKGKLEPKKGVEVTFESSEGTLRPGSTAKTDEKGNARLTLRSGKKAGGASVTAAIQYGEGDKKKTKKSEPLIVSILLPTIAFESISPSAIFHGEESKIIVNVTFGDEPLADHEIEFAIGQVLDKDFKAIKDPIKSDYGKLDPTKLKTDKDGTATTAFAASDKKDETSIEILATDASVFSTPVLAPEKNMRPTTKGLLQINRTVILESLRFLTDHKTLHLGNDDHLTEIPIVEKEQRLKIAASSKPPVWFRSLEAMLTGLNDEEIAKNCFEATMALQAVGERYSLLHEAQWSQSPQAVNDPMTMTMGQQVILEAVVFVPRLEKEVPFSLKGTSDLPFFSFTSDGAGAMLKKGRNVVRKIKSAGKLADAVAWTNAPIKWQIGFDQKEISLGVSGPHLIFTTFGKSTRSDDAYLIPTAARMRLATYIFNNVLQGWQEEGVEGGEPIVKRVFPDLSKTLDLLRSKEIAVVAKNSAFFTWKLNYRAGVFNLFRNLTQGTKNQCWLYPLVATTPGARGYDLLNGSKFFLGEGADCISNATFIAGLYRVLGLPGQVTEKKYVAFYRTKKNDKLPTVAQEGTLRISITPESFEGSLERFPAYDRLYFEEFRKAVDSESPMTPIAPKDFDLKGEPGLSLTLTGSNCIGPEIKKIGWVGCGPKGFNNFEGTLVFQDVSNNQWYYPGGTGACFNESHKSRLLNVSFYTLGWVGSAPDPMDPKRRIPIIKAVDWEYSKVPEHLRSDNLLE